MHELSIAMSVMEVIEKALGGRKPIESVHMTLGVLSGVNAHSLEFCFTEIAQQEGFGNPTLIIEVIPAKIQCHECDHEYETSNFDEGCPCCGSISREIMSGYGCDVDWIKIGEDNDGV